MSSSSTRKIALVVGSSGVLGSTVSTHLAKRLSMKVIGADMVTPPSQTASKLDGFIKMPSLGTQLGQACSQLTRGLKTALADKGEKIDLVVVASGGFGMDHEVPGSSESHQVQVEEANEFGNSIERMLQMNLHPVLATSYAVNSFMTEGQGLFVVVGATAALQPTPSMLGYGVSKAATHFVVQSLGASTGLAATGLKTKRKEGKRLRRDRPYLDDMTYVGILPTMIDTEANRKASDADPEQMTKPIDIATEIGEWVQKPYLRPHSGSLVRVFPNLSEGGATFQLVR